MSKQQLKFKPSNLSNNIATQAANEELKKSENYETLRSFYTKLMNQLEIDGIPKEKISIVGQKIVLEKKRSIRKDQGATQEELEKINIGRDWFEVARELNYVDPKYSHPIDAEPHQENSSITEIEKENSQYINLILDTITFLKDIALPKLKENPFMSLLDNADNKVTLALHDWKAHLDMAQSFFDHKEKIPVNTQHILLHAIGTHASNNDAGAEYFRLRTNAHKVTGKQISKYRSGQIQTKLVIFNPQDRITAILWNYYGVQCKSCNSWKVLELNKMTVPPKVKCMDCNNIFAAPAVLRCNYCKFPYFDEEVKYILDNNKCPNCKQELPEYLINNLSK